MDDSTVTYAEVREWVHWLKVFTPSELADAMAIDVAVAERFMRAALWHGMVEDTGVRLNGYTDEEPLYRRVKLEFSDGPREYNSGWLAPEKDRGLGCYDLAPIRGLPVFIRKQDQKGSSTPGVRLRLKLKEQRRKNMEQARMDAMEAQRKARIRKESYLD